MVILRKLGPLVSRKIIQDASLVTAANLGRTACIFLGWIVLARVLPPASFGTFAVAYGAMTLVAQLSESGLGIGVVKLLSQASTLSDETLDALRGSFLMRTGVTLAAVISMVLGANWLAPTFFHDASTAAPLRLAGGGALGSSYFAFILSCYQGSKRFTEYALLSGIAGASWVIGLAGLHLTGSLSVETTLMVAGCSFVLPAVLGHMRLGTSLLGLPRSWEPFKQLMVFSKWTGLSGLIVLLIMQGDVFLLGYLSSLPETGVYSAGQRLAMSISVITNSVLTVMLPSVLAQPDVRKLKQGLLSSLRVVALTPLLLAAIFLVAPSLVLLLYGKGFATAAPVFTILFGALLLSVFTNSLGFIYYSLDLPQVITVSLALQFLVLVIAGYVLAPVHGAIGMALAVALSRLVGFLVTLLPVFFLRDRHEVQVA